MSDSLRDKKASVRRLCIDALVLASALILSYVEHLLPLTLLIPFPGVKLGLANIAVMYLFFSVSKLDAAAVSLVRVFMSALLFGSAVSFLMSLGGALLSYAAMLSVSYLYKKEKISFVGVSVVSAILHGVGQLAAASLIYTPAVFSYLPVLMAGGTVTGCVSGIVLNIIYKRIENLTNA